MQLQGLNRVYVSDLPGHPVCSMPGYNVRPLTLRGRASCRPPSTHSHSSYSSTTCYRRLVSIGLLNQKPRIIYFGRMTGYNSTAPVILYKITFYTLYATDHNIHPFITRFYQGTLIYQGNWANISGYSLGYPYSYSGTPYSTACKSSGSLPSS